MSYNNIFPNLAATQAATQAPAFIKPTNAFYLQGYKVMPNTSIRNYLIQVTTGGNLIAYCFDEEGNPEINRGLPLIIKRSLVNSIPNVLARLGLNESFERLERKEFLKRELKYLELVKLPQLNELLKLDFKGQANLMELADSMKRVSSRNASIFATHVKNVIKENQK